MSKKEAQKMLPPYDYGSGWIFPDPLNARVSGTVQPLP